MKQGRPTPWSRLDNAAKIFPPTSSSRDPKVFRFTCELSELVIPENLQMALDKTLEQFALYRSVLKKGLFWYYFEASGLRPVVREENEPPCRPLFDRDRHNLLFVVTYYRRRINLEVYHALSDGTGALHFLRMLVFHYLSITHIDAFPDGLPEMDYDASDTQKRADSFSKYYAGRPHTHTEKAPTAYQLSGEHLPEKRLGVIEGHCSVKELLQVSRAHHTTLTSFLTATLMLAIHEEMPVRAQKRPVIIAVPVNLRNFFPSQSARNFFSVINVGYRFSKEGGNLDDVIKSIDETMRRELSTECQSVRLNRLSALEHTLPVQIVPLAVKNICLRFAGWLDDHKATAAFSNIGTVKMPSELSGYIRLFHAFITTKRIQICMCSFGDRLVLSVSSPFVSCDIQRRFFRMLADSGIHVCLMTNLTGQERREGIL